MRSDFLLQLIDAFVSNDELRFINTVNNLAEEERKKGNQQLYKKIINAINKKSVSNVKSSTSQKSFSPSSGLVMYEPSTIYSPKEKVNNNNLFELYYPEEINSQEIILSSQIEEKINQIASEYSQKETLLRLGLPFENRLLLCGPPGCGKTSTAYSLAKRLNLPIAYVRLDALVSSLLGQTGSNIRKIFDSVNGKEVILFLDEFDAIAKRRDDKHELGELKRVVNTLLQNIDMLSDDVFLIAATNHQDLLDSAVWRRFNTVLLLEYPDETLRTKYLKQQLESYNLETDVDYSKISKITKGMSFSNLKEITLKSVKNTIFHLKMDKITTNDIIKTTIQSMLLYNNPSSIDTELLLLLKKNGLTLREISEITSIPKSTISDRLKEMSSGG
ncbi:AAA family ATPase [Brevibacillus gelatini]